MTSRSKSGSLTPSLAILFRGAAVRREGLALTPGMPAELFITTGDRSLLSYLLKPLMDQIGRAFRDG